MTILGIDTSGSGGSVALLVDGRLVEERTLSTSGRRHARTLVPELGSLLRGHGLGPRDVSRLAVSIGPGSFTGLRVGAVCAKTFAYAAGCELAAVDTFAAIAAVQRDAPPQVWVIDDALRGDVFAAEYFVSGEECRLISRPGLLPVEEFVKFATGRFVTGPGADKYAEELSGCTLGSPEDRHPRASAVAQLGATATRVDCWSLEPFYIRRSAAEEKADGGKGGRVKGEG